jgi:peptide/nickel transport system permease protein
VRAYTLSISVGPKELWKSTGIFLLIMFIFNRLGSLLSRLPWLSKQLVFPTDIVIMRVAEIFSAMPRLILVIVMAVALRGLTRESIWLMIALIGAFGWTGVAKLVRAELLRVRALDYVSAARGVGMSEWRVLFRHALPNTLRPIYIVIAFGVGGAVLLEAYLSFLGFGGQSFRGISWGSLFINENSAGNPLDTWWVTVFPGIMIFLTVLSLNSIGEALSQR